MTTAAPPLRPSLARAPFLVWPVSQREFYLAISIALMPTLAWGCIVFGWRVLAMLIGATLVSGAISGSLRRWTARGQSMRYSHTLMSALVLVALAEPIWPVWMVTVTAATIPLIVWALGGPARERIHVNVVCAILLQLLITSLMPQNVGGGGAAATRPAGILARDRLLMGDIRNAHDPSSASLPLYRWLKSWELEGDDVMPMSRPQRVAFAALDRVSTDIAQAAAPAASSLPQKDIHPLDDVLANDLPSVEMLLLGAVPGRVGMVSLAGILLGGLYLAYRYILRPRSVALFLFSYMFTLALVVISPLSVAKSGLPAWWHLWQTIPEQLLTLVGYAFLNGDIAFATVFILALPGTEPLTPRGRQVFLVVAGILAAGLDRLNFNWPAATIVLCTMMPLAGTFDRMFAKRSWLRRAKKS